MGNVECRWQINFWSFYSNSWISNVFLLLYLLNLYWNTWLHYLNLLLICFPYVLIVRHHFLVIFSETATRGVSCKKLFLKTSKFTGRHVCWSCFFNKVADLRPVTLLKNLNTFYSNCVYFFLACFQKVDKNSTP